jgi:hypothetical protein
MENTIFLDDCMYHIIKAQEYLEMYQEMDDFDAIFEAMDPKKAVQLKNNETAIKGGTNHIQAAFQAIVNLIKNIIHSIRDFFAKRFMKESERQAYESFKAACKANPELRNKQVTVLDFRKFNKEYEELLAEAESVDRALAEGKDAPADEIIKKMASFCSGATKGAMTAVGCEVALNFASSSREAAQKMLGVLQKDEQVHQAIVDAIGKKEATKFEKELKALGKRALLKRQIMKMKGTYCTSLEDAIQKTFKEVTDIAEGAGTVAGMLPANDPSKSKLGNIVATAGAIIKGGSQSIDAGKKIIKGNKVLSRAMGNEQINSGVKNALDTNSKIQAEAREQYKDATRKKKPKKQRLEDQSMTDALFGRNDPNSLRSKGKRFFKR